jgi:hypothetical protein
MAFDFFRKYQRPILFGAGIFALVSFSITGEMISLTERLFRSDVELPTVVVDGKRIRLTAEDQRIASQVARYVARPSDPRAVNPLVVLPPLGDQDVQEVVAAYRRIAITYGIGWSQVEVRKALEQAREYLMQPDLSLTDLALRLGFRSLRECEVVVGEALRVATLMRLESLSFLAGDSEFASELAERTELLTLDVASLSVEDLRETLEEQELGDEELQAYLDELKSDADPRYVTFTSPNRASLELFALEVDAFDPADYAVELEGFEVSDAEVEARYNIDRSAFYRTPKEEKPQEDKPGDEKPQDQKPEDGGEKPQDEKPADEGGEKPQDEQPQDQQNEDEGESKPDEQTPESDGGDENVDEQDPEAEEPQEEQKPFLPLDDELRARIRKQLLAEHVLRTFWKTLPPAQFDVIQDALGARQSALEALEQARSALAEGEENDVSSDELATLRAAVDAASASLATADAALDAARLSFEVESRFREFAAGRPGYVVVRTEGDPKPAPDLRELPQLGNWPRAMVGADMERAGDLAGEIRRTSDYVFGFRTLVADFQPLKPFDEIRERVQGMYWTEKATERAEELSKKFEEKLAELGRARNADRVAEVEATRETRIEERMTTWREDLESRRSEVQKLLAGTTDTGSRAYRSYQSRLQAIETELADVDGQRERVAEAVDAEIESEIAEIAREAIGDVFADAAAAAEFEVRTVGPLPRNLSRRPRFKERYDEVVRFLFRSQVQDLEAGDATDLEFDRVEQMYVQAVCKAVEEGSLADVTRRQLLQLRQLEEGRRLQAFAQSYTLEALKDRWGWLAAGREEIAAPTPPGGSAPANKDG